MSQLNDVPRGPAPFGVYVPTGLMVGGVIVGLIAVSMVMLPLLHRRPQSRRPAPQSPGQRWTRVLGNALLVAGVAVTVLAAVYYITDPTGGSRELPRPVALEAAETSPTAAESTPTPTETPRAVVLPTREGSATPTATRRPTETPTVTPTPVPTGVPVRMVIPSIGVDSGVQEAGTYWQNGQLLYETLPYLIAHYRMTAQAGALGNAVFSGHVVTRNYGNVFRDLYKIRVGDEVRILSSRYKYVYVVSGVREVSPTDVSVMNPTPDATATLITCSGEWIPDERQYSRRLIVVAKLKTVEPLS